MKIKVKVVGCGGVGGWLIRPMVQYLAYLGVSPKPEISLVDGDSYTEGNRDRQTFAELGNKAEVTMSLLMEEYADRIQFFARPVYVDDGNVAGIVRSGDIIMCCADNFDTRKLLSLAGERCSDVLIIAGGNEYTDGSIQCFLRTKDKNVTLPLTNEFHPEVANASRENNPAYRQRMAGCEEESKVSAPQLVPTNNFVAAVMLNALAAFLQGRMDYDEAYLDILHNAVCVERRTQHG